MSDRLAVGLAGAGPWARNVHAPMLAAGPETRLAGVWSRTESSARALAGEHGVPALASFDALLDACDAVAIAVPPDAQPDLAVRAARAGKALLLEKPLALDVDGAERIAAAVEDAHVGSVMVLTYRFAPSVREFLTRAASFPATGGRACFLSGAFLGGPYAGSGWRVEHGALLDVGPHILDLVDAALGPIVALRAHGDRNNWIGLLADHESGASSEVSISCMAAITPSRTEVEIFSREGSLAVDGRSDSRDIVFANLRADFAAAAASGGPHPCDAARGLRLQHLLAMAETALAHSHPARRSRPHQEGGA
ncbi:MAG: Gfo/Idh/MocA family protein [Acidimicrobiia bacterium]